MDSYCPYSHRLIIILVNEGEEMQLPLIFNWNSRVINAFSSQHTYLGIFKVTSENTFLRMLISAYIAY